METSPLASQGVLFNLGILGGVKILLHSSKTMRSVASSHPAPLGLPGLLDQATELHRLLLGLSAGDIEALMKVSSKKASEVQGQLRAWSATEPGLIPAIDAFLGDIYSGLQVRLWSDDDRRYAQEHLLILSGLYGALRACDGIKPYRFEMGYKLPDGRSAYAFWGNKIAQLIKDEVIINLSAVEYTKGVLPHLEARVITPKFLTISPKTGEPVFVTVHAKIARGAFAYWLVKRRSQSTEDLTGFVELGYRYDASRSVPDEPVFVCAEFGGIGLSVRK